MLPENMHRHVHFVLGAYLPATGYGGPITKVRALAPALTELGVGTTVITSQLSAAGVADLPTGQDTTVIPETWRLPTILKYRWSSVVRWNRTIPQPDIYHVIGAWNGICYQAMQHALANNIPFVWEPAGMLVERGRKRAIKRSMRPVHQHFANKSAAMIWTSQQEEVEAAVTSDAHRSYFRPNVRPQVPAGSRTTIQKPAGKTVYGYLGRIAERKGIERILTAWRAGHDDSLLWFAGPVESPQLRDRIRKATRTTLFDPLDNTEKWHWLRSLDCLILFPEYGENFGNVVLESLAAGTPVVASQQVGVTGWFEDPGLTVLPSVDDLADFFAAGKHPPAPGQLPDIFDPEQVARQQLDIYNKVLH